MDTGESNKKTGWYCGVQGRQSGPMAEDELRAMIAAGQLGPQTMVWREGLPAWQPLTAFPELCVGQSWMVGYGAPVAPVSGLAIASLVCGIVSVFLCYVHGVAAVPAVICGHMALRRIRDSAVPSGGRGMAIGGLVTGYLGVLAQLATLAFIGFFVFGVMKSTTGAPFSGAPPVKVPVAPSTGPVVAPEVEPAEVPENVPEPGVMPPGEVKEQDEPGPAKAGGAEDGP